MKKQKISYIKKPFAGRSFLSLGLGLAALILSFIGVSSSVMAAGEAGLNVAAVCFCGILLALVSLIYGGLSFLEKDRKYILSKIGMGISGVLVIAWVILIAAGLS